MFKQILFGFFSLIGVSAQASNMIEIEQTTILKDKNDSYYLVDVRSPQEFASGHIPNAINIPLSEISSNLEQLRNIKDKEIVLYCRSGFRAKKASSIMQNHGFTNLYHLEGDMLGWQKSGLVVEK